MANYVIGAADTASGVAANATAPLAGETVVIPAYTDAVDGPKAFIEFVNSLPAGGKVTIADTAPPQRAATLWYQGSTGKMYVSDGTAWIQTGGTL